MSRSVINIYEVVGLVKHTGSPQRFGGAVKGARRAFIEDFDSAPEPTPWARERSETKVQWSFVP